MFFSPPGLKIPQRAGRARPRSRVWAYLPYPPPLCYSTVAGMRARGDGLPLGGASPPGAEFQSGRSQRTKKPPRPELFPKALPYGKWVRQPAARLRLCAFPPYTKEVAPVAAGGAFFATIFLGGSTELSKPPRPELRMSIKRDRGTPGRENSCFFVRPD